MTNKSLRKWIEDSQKEYYPSGHLLNTGATWISTKHKYFCMAVPKVACTKIKMDLQKLEGYALPPDPYQVHFRNTSGYSFLPSVADFSTEEVVEMLTSPNWFRFCFVRNPYSRLFSGYKSQVMDLTSPYVSFRESIREDAGCPTLPGATPKIVDFGDFVRYIGKQLDVDRDNHWQSQVGILHMHIIKYDFVGRFEKFAHDFAEVLKRLGAPSALIQFTSQVENSTQPLPLSAAYDKKLADYVYDMYKNDFDAFGYEEDSWMIDS